MNTHYNLYKMGLRGYNDYFNNVKPAFIFDGKSYWECTLYGKKFLPNQSPDQELAKFYLKGYKTAQGERYRFPSDVLI